MFLLFFLSFFLSKSRWKNGLGRYVIATPQLLDETVSCRSVATVINQIVVAM